MINTTRIGKRKNQKKNDQKINFHDPLSTTLQTYFRSRHNIIPYHSAVNFEKLWHQLSLQVGLPKAPSYISGFS